MAKHPSHQTNSQIQESALKVAKATQRPGQTKEQTKLIAQGIEKGIAQYKKQQSEKARELDKRLKKAARRPADEAASEPVINATIVYKQHWLPWLLLALSWLGWGIYAWFGGKL